MTQRFFLWLLRLAARLLLRVKVVGWENLPEGEAAILMVNHIHFLDPFVTAAAMPRPMTAMSKIENFSIPVFGLIFKLYGAIPVRRGTVDRQALKQVLKELKKDDALLLVAPEGTRSPNRALQNAHNGLAYIAHHSKAAIVPLAITGTADFDHHWKRLRRTPVQLKLGRPFYLRANSRRLERQALHAMTSEAMYQLAAVLPPDHRGLYSDLEQATKNHVYFLDSENLSRQREGLAPASGEG
jgi:1-acyl-sn-glycerol-3-phosphate acyltransferase